MMLFLCFCFFFFNDPATTEIYTLSLHDALPIFPNQNGTILSQRESRSLVSDVLSARETAAMMAQARSPLAINAPQVTGAAMHGVEARLNKLIQLVEQNRQVQAQANYTIINEGSAPNPVEMELQRISGLVRRGGL